MTTDTLVENVDFKRSWISPELLGRKALAVSLSDLAANGARPVAFLMNLVLPASLTGVYFRGLVVGTLQASEMWRVPLVGGDISSGDSVQITVTALGAIRSGEALLRSAARPGDWIFLVGEVGWSRLGLDILRAEDPDLSAVTSAADLKGRAGRDDRLHALTAHLIPEPLIDAGLWLQESGLVHAAIDVSDGIASDLCHIMDESNVGAELDLAAIIPPEAPIRRAGLPERLVEQAVLNGGEDYALVVTVPAERRDALKNSYPASLPSLVCIGRITEESGFLLRSHGTVRPYIPEGFDHFK